MRASVALPVNVALLAVLAATVAPPLAAALEPGVHVDPGSPAAKEYALPLSQARQTGAPPSSGGSSAPLFGAGIGPHPHRALPHAGSQTSKGSSARPKKSGVANAALAARASRAGGGTPRASGGSDSLLAILGGAVLILAVGTVGGVVLRGRRSAHSL